MKKYVIALSMSIAMLLALGGTAFAHVGVTPKSSSPAAWETYTIKVPNEKDIPTTGLRLVMPKGGAFHGSSVNKEWNVETVKKDDKVTEIKWTGGEVPAEQFETFQITVQNPPKPTTLVWKAYQTYEDGSVVAWVQKEGEEKPASRTEIAEAEKAEVKPASSITKGAKSENDGAATQTPILSIAALILSIAAMGTALLKRQSN